MTLPRGSESKLSLKIITLYSAEMTKAQLTLPVTTKHHSHISANVWMGGKVDFIYDMPAYREEKWDLYMKHKTVQIK